MHSALFAGFAVNLFGGWLGFLVGAVSGAVLGMRFHREDWLGGYASFPRRMLRLGHIACFGLGLINILFALSARQIAAAGHVASIALIVGLVTMPLICFLTAWKRAFKSLFFIPVGAVSLGIAATVFYLL
jgi:hypothetical protein